MAASGSDAEGLHSTTLHPRKIIEAGIGYGAGGKVVEVLLGSVSAIELSGRSSFQKAV